MEAYQQAKKWLQELYPTQCDQVAAIIGGKEGINTIIANLYELTKPAFRAAVDLAITSAGHGSAHDQSFQRNVRHKGATGATVKKHFATGGPVDPARHFFVPMPSKRLEENILGGKYCLLLAHRQAGKSTLALRTQAIIQNCYYIYMEALDRCNMTIWTYLHWQLHQCDPERFPRPAVCTHETLEDMLWNVKGPISIVIDEANLLAKINPSDLKLLLEKLRKLKHRTAAERDSSMGVSSVVLIGTYDLSELVKEGDTLISPFVQEDRISPRRLKKENLKELLMQWKEERAHLSLGSTVDEFAASIQDLVNGHPGIQGVCCDQLDKAAEQAHAEGSSYSLKNFESFACQGLLKHVESSTSFQRMLQDFTNRFTPSQQAMLHRVLLDEEVKYDAQNPDQVALLDKGFIIVEQRRCNEVEQGYIIISAPLIASVLMARYHLVVPEEVELPDADAATDPRKLGLWMLQIIAQHLDLETVRKAEALTKLQRSGLQQSSEYNFQLQCALLIQECYNRMTVKTKKLYKLVIEARQDGVRTRLDLVAVNGALLRMGHELSVAASQSIFDAHVKKASAYAQQHNCLIWAVDLRCCEGVPEDDCSDNICLPNPSDTQVIPAKIRFYPACEKATLQVSGQTNAKVVTMAHPVPFPTITEWQSQSLASS